MLMLCVLILSCACVEADVFTPDQKKQLDDFVDNLMSCSKVPGLTVAVVRGNETFSQGYGFRDVENKVPATEDTRFCIGSLTKAFTATLLSKLLPQKYPKLLWDTKLKEILGDNFKLATDELTDQVTLKDILTHRTGLVSGDYGLFAGYPDTVSREDIISKLRYLPVSQPLRYHFAYNNWMYVLAGYVTEVLSGGQSSWEDLLTEHILQPLGMSSTVVFTNPDELTQTTQFSLPYVYMDGQFQRLSLDLYSLHPGEPAGAMCSSANDMNRWMQFLLQTPNSPRLRDILNDTAFNQTLRPLQLTPLNAEFGNWRPPFPVDNYQFAYGMGWFIGAYRGHQTTAHSGSWFAYNSLITLFRESNFGIFLSINAIPQEQKKINLLVTSFISDLLLGESPWLNASTACSFPQPWIEETGNRSSHSNDSANHPDVTPQRHLTTYVGTFGHRLIGDVKITVATENSLEFSFGRFHALLYPTRVKDEFRWEVTGSFSFLSSTGSTSRDKTQFFYTNGQIDAFSCSVIGKQFVFRKNVRFSDTGTSDGNRLAIYSIVNIFTVIYTLLNLLTII